MGKRGLVLPDWIHELLLGIGLFLGGIAVNSMHDIAAKLEDMRVLLATAGQQVSDHEARITRIENFLSGR